MKPTCESLKYRKFIEKNSIYTFDETQIVDRHIPEIDFTYSKEFVISALNFDNHTNVFNFHSCQNCNRTFPDRDLNGKFCIYCNSDAGAYKWGPFNNIHVGSVPEELKDLSYITQMLIARVHPVVGMYRIRGAQYGYHGHVINFKQNIYDYLNKLPVHPKDLPSTFVFNRETQAGPISLQVDGHKLMRALIWLKEHNQYYKDIEINYEIINDLIRSPDVTSSLPNCEFAIDQSVEGSFDSEISNEQMEFSESYVPSLNNYDHERNIYQKLELPYPSIDTKLIDEFKTEGYIVCAFPCLFPYGLADYRTPRDVTIELREWFQYLMDQSDRRFARDPRFRFFAMNTLLRRQALSQASYFTNNKVIPSLNVDQLRQKINEDPKFLQHIMPYIAHIRSTKPYWSQRTYEILAMTDQIGCPTVFFTLSSADYHWVGLYRLLSGKEDISDLTPETRKKLMHDNPMLVAWYFKHRVECFFADVLVPLFGIIEWWYRFEWQFRGSPHVHGLLWFKNAPIFDYDSMTDERKHVLKFYFDEFCFAFNPNLDIKDSKPCSKNFSEIIVNTDILQDLNDMLNFVQKHTKHGPHCLKKNKNNIVSCRFRYPKAVTTHSSFSVDENNEIYEPSRNDESMGKYNPYVTSIWRANTDISPVTNSKTASRYIGKYAGKGEIASKPYLSIMNALVNDPTITCTKKMMKKFFIGTLGDRDYSAQEVVHILMDWPLYRYSRSFVTINLSNELWYRVNVNSDNKKIPQPFANIEQLQFVSIFTRNYSKGQCNRNTR